MCSYIAGNELNVLHGLLNLSAQNNHIRQMSLYTHCSSDNFCMTKIWQAVYQVLGTHRYCIYRRRGVKQLPSHIVSQMAERTKCLVCQALSPSSYLLTILPTSAWFDDLRNVSQSQCFLSQQFTHSYCPFPIQLLSLLGLTFPTAVPYAMPFYILPTSLVLISNCHLNTAIFFLSSTLCSLIPLSYNCKVCLNWLN